MEEKIEAVEIQKTMCGGINIDNLIKCTFFSKLNWFQVFVSKIQSSPRLIFFR